MKTPTTLQKHYLQKQEFQTKLGDEKMTAKGLNMKTSTYSYKGRISLAYTTQNSIPLYYSDSFMGRDADEQKTRVSGLTQWVATNFDLLFPGEEPPYDYRIVDGVSRARWENYSADFMERWLPQHATRHIVRKSFDYKDRKLGWTSQFLLFPHPEDAEAMNLIGSGGEFPAALFNLRETDDGHAVITRIFRTIKSPSVDDGDLILTCPFETADAYEAKGWANVDSVFASNLNGMDSKMEEVQKELTEWNQFLDWTEDSHNKNSWSGEITEAAFIQSEKPMLRLKLKSKGRDLALIKQIPTRGKRFPVAYLEPSTEENTLEDSVSKSAQKVKLGNVRRINSKSKGNATLEVWLYDDHFDINPNSIIGQCLVNKPSDDYGTLVREKKGLERLQQLESPANMHDWIFDISNAKPGPKEPPELEFELVDKLNAEQEWAVRSALAAPEVYLIQGPPGTGKTTVIAELTNQVTKKGGRVLIASQTNLAVDNALSRLKHKTNVRPIRHLGTFAAKNPDSESEPFLENNVVKSFFLPAVKEECSKAQERAETLLANQAAIKRFREDSMPIVESNNMLVEQIIAKQQERKSLQLQRQSIIDEEQKIEHQEIVINNSLSLIQDSRWGDLSFESLENPQNEMELLEQIVELSNRKERLNSLNEAIEILGNKEVQGSVSDEEINLRAELKQSIDEERFMDAQQIKEELDQIDKINRQESKSSWSTIGRKLSRLGERLQNKQLSEISVQINPPENFSVISSELSKQFSLEVNEIHSTTEMLIDLEEQLSESLLERRNAAHKGLGNNGVDKGGSRDESRLSEKIDSLDSQISMLRRKQSDNEERMNSLILDLPESMIENISLENGVNEEIVKRLHSDSKIWEKQNSELISNNKKWLDLRKAWIDAIDASDDASIADLKSLYLKIVNVHGVTTALSGSKYWWEEHAAQPFDVVIIDEISKATPPEIILASLLGKKVIWVGDHRQLAPEFNDPRKSTNEDSDEDVEAHAKGAGKFKEMVTTALFERHFIEADPTLKSSLHVQYRMHEQIMDSINEFYEGNLRSGLSAEQQTRTKKHGIAIVKKDDYGSAFDRGSKIIQSNRHIYWIDSAFNRKKQYCSEEQVGTSKKNTREVDIAEELFDRINEQIGLWKNELPETPTNWLDLETPFGKLNKEGKLEVAFITFYAAQKRAFERQIFGGGNNSTEERWKHLELKVDSVDRFQGGERPIVIVSMVSSSNIDEGQRRKINRLMKKYSVPNDKWLVSGKPTKNQFSIRPPTSRFAKSPNRVNVAFSRAQNLLLIIGNRWGWKNCKMTIKRDNGQYERVHYYNELQNKIRGGVIDGCELL